MCGLVGVVFAASDFSVKVAKSTVRLMSDKLTHRGPDSEGSWVSDDAFVALGHRRLAILDLTDAGAQPMDSASGRWMIVFNGEVYNYRDIAEQLTDEGVTLNTNSDTEVLVSAVELWGFEKAIQQCAGMFAVAAWDKKNQELFLAKDRLGEKPLYYGYCGGDFVFASELGAFKEHPSWTSEISKKALSAYMRYGYVPTPLSIYAGIQKIPAACFARISRADLEQQKSLDAFIYRYWSSSFNESEECGQPEQYWVDGLDERLHDVVKQQMISDVPIGAFLSGGVDSSIVASIMQAESSVPINTFTIGFDAKEFNEAEHAKKIASHLGTNHNELYITAHDVMGVIDKLPQIYDEPFADSSQLPMYLLCSMAREHVTVCLSGDGGDELFCGYNRYLHVDRLWSSVKVLPPVMRGSVAAILSGVSPVFFDKAIVLFSQFSPSLKSVQIGNSQVKIKKIISALKAESYQDLYLSLVSFCNAPDQVVIQGSDGYCDYDNAFRLGDSFGARALMNRDQQTYLCDDNLVKVDRAAMAVSLEGRLPLLNHNVVEFANTVPLEHMVKEGKSKWLLRRVLYRYVPQDLIERPKMGFSVPLAAWLRGPLKDWAASLLTMDKLEKAQHLNAKVVNQYWRDHQAGRVDNSMVLWSILMFQLWLENE